MYTCIYMYLCMSDACMQSTRYSIDSMYIHIHICIYAFDVYICEYAYIDIYEYAYIDSMFTYTNMYTCVYTCTRIYVHLNHIIGNDKHTLNSHANPYGMATISRLLKIIGLFCKRALQKRRYSAKETYHFKEPTHRSHRIVRTRTHNTLHHTAPNCVTLHYDVPPCTTLYHPASPCTTQHHTLPHSTALHHPAPPYTTLRHVAKHTQKWCRAPPPATRGTEL